MSQIKQPEPTQAAGAATMTDAKLWCETCEGTGRVTQEHQKGSWSGGEHTCPDCDGNGYRVRLAPTANATSAPTDAKSAAGSDEGVEYIHELVDKLERFIDYATGGKLSNSSWALETLKAACDEHFIDLSMKEDQS